MIRGYQYGFSKSSPYVHDKDDHGRNARTMPAVLEIAPQKPRSESNVLCFGGSAGAIENLLAVLGAARLQTGLDRIASVAGGLA